MKSLFLITAAYVASISKRIPEEQIKTLPEACRVAIVSEYLLSRAFFGGQVPEILLQVSEIERVDFSDRLNINETLENIHSSSVTTLGELVLNKKASESTIKRILDGKIRIKSLVLDRCYQIEPHTLIHLMQNCSGFGLIKRLSLRYLKITNRHLVEIASMLSTSGQTSKTRLQLTELNVEHCDLITSAQIVEFKKQVSTACRLITD